MTKKPLWSFALIAKNEAKTLPRLVKSLAHFQQRGGEIVIVDTGSTDNTPAVARRLGCRVFEEKERFLTKLSRELVKAINARFLVNGDQPIVNEGDRLFDFSSARNYAASLTKSPFVAMPDCDEIWTTLDIDAVNDKLESGIGQLEYNFVFSHDQFGKEAVKFLHSKFYDRRKIRWTGIVHEVLIGNVERAFMGEDTMKLEHWQNHETDRGGYLPGLALDCFLHPDNDRNSHYLARELMWRGRTRSAMQEFKRHVAMNRWPAEKSQSLVYIGDCCATLGGHEEALEWFFKAFLADPRREPLLRLAHHFWRQNDPKHAAAFANACLPIPWDGFYSNNISHYTHEPHEILYWALWYLGDRAGSKKHWEKASLYLPRHPKVMADSQFYWEYPDNGIDGWMTCEELNWLKETAKEMRSIAELGSWKGRSTHALCTGCEHGVVTAIDHFEGSPEALHQEARADGDPIFTQFKQNTAKFKNLAVNRKSTQEAASDYPDGHFDMVFIDADHSYDGVKRDILAWRAKAKYVLCGHDYVGWPGVQKAVDELIGPVKVVGSIWIKDFRTATTYLKALSLRVMEALLLDNTPFSFVKLGDGEQACMDGASGTNCDGHPYTPQLAERLRASFAFLQHTAHVVKFEDQANYNVLLHRTDTDLADRKRFYGTIRNLPRRKVFVGPRRLGQVAFMLKSEHVYVPLVNAFEQYDAILADLKTRASDGTVFMFSAGLPAKVWMADLLRYNPNITCLDTGSAFDPIFIGETRTTQASQAELQKLYSEWLQFPRVSVVLPTLGREEKLARCLAMIQENADYPNYEVIVKHDQFPPNNIGVPTLLKQGVAESSGELVMYMGNDCMPGPGFMLVAVTAMVTQFPNLDGLVGTNDGYWKGEFATHWLAGKALLPLLDGEFFHTGYYHCGCDNELTERTKQAGKYYWCKDANVFHEHPVLTGFKQEDLDQVYDWAYNHGRQTHDKELLVARSKRLGLPAPKVYAYPKN